jgi:branched-chain amino acid transport system substrate-binding protein
VDGFDAGRHVRRGPNSVEIAAALSLTGDSYTFGRGSLESIQFAVEDANATGMAPRIVLTEYDDKSTDAGAREVAARVVASRALLVLGPAISTASLAAGPIYANGPLASLTTTATSDLVTDNPTTFRVLFKNSEQGEMLATYLYRVLHRREATVIVVDDGYGRTLETGFRRVADRVGIKTRYFTFKTEQEADLVAQQIAATRDNAPIVFATLDGDGARILTSLRRAGITGPFLGGDAFGDDSFSQRLEALPEERQQRGFFTDELYGISPMILDSANAGILSFAQRFKARFGHEPVWFSVASYDATKIAIAALRFAAAANPSDLKAQRAAVLQYLNSLNDPASASAGLLGPLAFDGARGRQQAIRIGHFYRGRFESAPLQIVPVIAPDPHDIANGAVFEVGSGRFARLQRVVYTGMFINEITRVDLSRSIFGADFYLWLRFAPDAGPGSPDPTDINFPGLVGGGFDRTQPVEQGNMPDGTVYRLWRIQGEFENDFDLRRFPFDKQVLVLPFSNSHAAADRIVYVLDQRLPATSSTTASGMVKASANVAGMTHAATHGAAQASTPTTAQSTESEAALAVASRNAFRSLSQWKVLGARQQRDNLVTESSLGDLRRVGALGYRELSGFSVEVDLQRQVSATLQKSLLPLLLMTLILLASLFFPVAMGTTKIAVALSGALSAAVLLSSINSQLGAVGYTVAVEYVFYVFFGLSLLGVLSALMVERLRAVDRPITAARTEIATRWLFITITVATIIAATWFFYVG